jgi:hypothetical protein
MIGQRRGPSEHARAQIAQLFAGEDGVERAAGWARAVLAQEGLEAARSPLRSLRALRRADRRLSPVTARYLVAVLAGRIDPSQETGSWNPLLH